MFLFLWGLAWRANAQYEIPPQDVGGDCSIATCKEGLTCTTQRAYNGTSYICMPQTQDETSNSLAFPPGTQ